MKRRGATALTVATYTEALESGFYLLSGSIYFEFRTDNAYFPLSTVHEMFALNYTDTTNEPQSTSAPGGVAAPKILPRDFLYCSRSVNIKEVCFV
jgi:hypothetical protein